MFKSQKFIDDVTEDPTLTLLNFYRRGADDPESKYFSNDLCCYNQSDCITIIDKQPMGSKGNVYRVIYDNNEYALKINPIYRYIINYQTRPPLTITHLETELGQKKNRDYISDFDLTTFIYVGSDSFTNELMISTFIQDFVQGFPFNGSINYHGASICSPPETLVLNLDRHYTSIALMEYADHGPLSMVRRQNIGETHFYLSRIKTGDSNALRDLLEEKTVAEIFKQIVSLLYHLKDYRFVHGKLLLSKILVASTPVNDQFNGVPLNLDFTIKLSDFDQSSVLIPLDGKLHYFYCREAFFDKYLSIPAAPYQIYSSDQYYILPDNFDSLTYQRIQQMGIPFYSSFDVYILLVSTMLNPLFHYSILEHASLSKWLWRDLWAPDDLGTVDQRMLDNLGSDTNMDKILSILRGIKLKHGILDQLMENIPSEYVYL